MNGLKDFFVTLAYIFFGLAILAVLGFSYLFAVQVSGADMNVFFDEKKEQLEIFVADAKVFTADLSENIATGTEYLANQIMETTKNIHIDAVERHQIMVLANSLPPVEVLTFEENTVDFTSEVFLSTRGEHKVVYYNQTTEPWRSIEYGPGNIIGTYGCGPTSMSMILSTFLQEDITPDFAANWAYNNGYFAKNSGSYHSLIPEMAEAFGLASTTITRPTKDDLISELSKGNLIVVLLGSGTLARGGHFVVLRDFTEDGEILIADSQSMNNSQQTWDANIFINEAKYYANSGGPFWSISSPGAKPVVVEVEEKEEILAGTIINADDEYEIPDHSTIDVVDSNGNKVETQSETIGDNTQIEDLPSHVQDILAPKSNSTTTTQDLINEIHSTTYEDAVQSINIIETSPVY